jgi:cytochrome c
MKTQLVLAMLGTAIAAMPALANEELAKKSACFACHQVDKKVVGPSYKEVAAKYKGDAKAEAMLIEKVKKGGVGTWGQVPMPANASVKDEDIKTLVKWILATK